MEGMKGQIEIMKVKFHEYLFKVSPDLGVSVRGSHPADDLHCNSEEFLLPVVICWRF